MPVAAPAHDRTVAPRAAVQDWDRVADRRCSAPEPAARRRETARLDHRKENGELIEARHPRSRHFKFLEQYPQYFMAIAERGERLSPGRIAGAGRWQRRWRQRS